MSHSTNRKFFILWGLCLISFSVAAQVMTEIKVKRCTRPYKERDMLEIKQVSIEDTFLIRQIEQFIADEERQDEYFANGIGYMRVRARSGFSDNLEQIYYINNEFSSLQDDTNDLAFPPYYTYVGGRIVFLYLPVLDGLLCYRYSKKSKRKLKKKLETYLPKSQTLVGRDENGKIIRFKNFREQEYIKLHGGRYIYIYSDGREPEVVPERY